MEPETTNPVNVLANPEKSIPKLSTGLGVNKIENGDLILTFFNQGSTPGSPLVMIETLIMTEKHVIQMIDALRKIIDERPHE